jgi:predicted amidophosphoribosyltransferase
MNFPAQPLLKLARGAFKEGYYKRGLEFLEKAPSSPEKQELVGWFSYLAGKEALSSQQFGPAEKYFSQCAELNKKTDPNLSSLCQLRLHLIRAFSAERMLFDPDRTIDQAHLKKVAKLLEDQFCPTIDSVLCTAAFRPRRDPQFDDDLSELIRLAKKGADPVHLKRLGELLAATAFRKKTIISAADLVIPVPSSPDRELCRGYSLPKLITEKFSELTAIPSFPTWVESKTAPDVRGLPKSEKKRQLKGVFSVTESRERLNGLSVIMVDDVITSGTTMLALAKELRGAGAKEVHALAIAHTECSPRYT